jgi:hypothetical protein
MFNPVNENDMNLIRRTGGFYPSFLEDFLMKTGLGKPVGLIQGPEYLQ